MLLVSLVGEQPIPNLLPIRYLEPARNLLVYTRKTEAVARRLRRVITGSADLSQDLQVQPFNLPKTLAGLQAAFADQAEVMLNLTGGTKVMVLAAYTAALQGSYSFVYLQTEGRKSLLYRYTFQAGLPLPQPPEEIPPIIPASEYLNAHLPGYKQEGFSRDERGELTPGGQFEKVVHHALDSRCDEVLAGVRPEGVARQIEIDLVIRCGNQVGIAEVKLGGGDSGKRGLDQLKMAGEPTYLGTYTAQFLIVAARKLSPSIETLARERGVKIIYVPEYTSGQPLPIASARRLADAVKNRLIAGPD